MVSVLKKEPSFFNEEFLMQSLRSEMMRQIFATARKKSVVPSDDVSA